MSDRGRCDACPADPAHLCLAQSTEHWRFCELAATDDGYRALIRERSGPATADWIPSADAPPHAPPPSVAAHWLAKGCDYLGPLCGRGCAGDRRICGAGRGAVSHSACMVCVADPSSPGGPVLD
jgi:hypothetical protein